MQKITLILVALIALAACSLRPTDKPITPPPSVEVPKEEPNETARKNDLIVVESPLINEKITSPLEVTGMARGYWFFEASFPVRLLDGNGQEIAVTPATSPDLWMTEDFISFFATLEFETPSTEKGTLILEKANASGLPEHDDRLEIPIKF